MDSAPTPTVPPKRRTRRPRFSLRTLMLAVLLTGSGGLLFYHREPWRLTRVWQEPESPPPIPSTKLNQFKQYLIRNKTELIDHGKHTFKRMDDGTIQIFNVQRETITVLHVPKDLVEGGDPCNGLFGRDVYCSPDGKRIVTLTSVAGGAHSTKELDENQNLQQARLWDASTGREIKILEHGGWIYSVVFSEDGETCATTGHDDTVKCWNAVTGELVFSVDHASEPGFCRHDEILVTTGDYNHAQFFDARTGKLKFKLPGRCDARIQHLDRGFITVTNGSDTKSTVWIEDGPERASFEGPITAFSPHLTRFATTERGQDNRDRVRIWDAATLQAVTDVHGSFVGFDADDEPIALDRKNTPWLRSPKMLADWTGGLWSPDPDFPNDSKIFWCNIAVSPEGGHCASYLDTGMEVWDAKDCEHRFPLGVVNESLSIMGTERPYPYFLDEHHIVALGDKDTLALWTYQRPIGLAGFLSLPELWFTIILVIAVTWSAVSEFKSEK